MTSLTQIAMVLHKLNQSEEIDQICNELFELNRRPKFDVFVLNQIQLIKNKLLVIFGQVAHNNAHIYNLTHYPKDHVINVLDNSLNALDAISSTTPNLPHFDYMKTFFPRNTAYFSDANEEHVSTQFGKIRFS